MPRNTRTAQSLGGSEPLFLPLNATEARYTAQVRAASRCIAYSHLPISRRASRGERASKQHEAAREFASLHRRHDATIQLARLARIAGDDAAANGYAAQVAVMYERLTALYPLLQRVGTMNLQAAA